MLLLLSSLVLLFSALGVWQLQRLAWKESLMATVDERIHAQPGPIPAVANWNTLNVSELVYLPVSVTGQFDHSAEIQSLAVSELGSGYWVMTPLRLEGGGSVLVNRGFVPQPMRDPAERPAAAPPGQVRVTGLLRASEPKGGFLRDNDPLAGRWYSRDVDAIAEATGLPTPVAPFFIDAADEIPLHTNAVDRAKSSGDDAAAVGGFPRAGLTVVKFRNTHLVYAITWFALALLSVVGIVLVLREYWRETLPEPSSRG